MWTFSFICTTVLQGKTTVIVWFYSDKQRQPPKGEGMCPRSRTRRVSAPRAQAQTTSLREQGRAREGFLFQSYNMFFPKCGYKIHKNANWLFWRWRIISNFFFFFCFLVSQIFLYIFLNKFNGVICKGLYELQSISVSPQGKAHSLLGGDFSNPRVMPLHGGE